MKKIFHLTALVLLMAFAPTLYAQPDFASGDGSASNPYMISTPQHLDNVRKHLGPGNTDTHFALANDIDMSSISNFKPIGIFPDNIYVTDSMFFGKFDGKGHVIRNLTIKGSATATPTYRNNCIGLFSYVERTGVIKNLGVEDAYLSHEGRDAGILAGTFGGIIENCHVTGKVFTNKGVNTGGLVGYAVTMDNTLPSSIRNSYSIVNMDIKTEDLNSSVGGIVGWGINTTISQCFSLCNIINEYGAGIGGICGQMGRGRIEYCYAYGYLRGLCKEGGIIGYQFRTNYLVGCYAMVEVIKSPYTDEEITDVFMKITFGGVLGAMYSTVEVLKECYYNKDVFKGPGVGVDASHLYEGGAKELITADTKKEVSYVGPSWKFGSRWAIWEGHTAPFFVNQCTPATISYAAPSYVEGTFKSTDAPDKIVLYNTDLKIVGEAVMNTSSATWRIDLVEPLKVDEYVYAVAVRGGRSTAPAMGKVANTYFNGGDGSVSNPFRITTPEQLSNVRFYLGESSTDMNFIVENDLDFKNEPVWTPIRSNESKVFYGKIDGKNFKIKNLKITSAALDSVGLFSAIGNTGVVKNFNLLGCTVTGKNATGAICGVNNGSITNCIVLGKITGNNNVGGICGINGKTISNSYSISTVKSTGAGCGGFCGLNTSSGNISFCYTMGEVSGNSQAGGFCGVNAGTLSKSFAGNVVASTTGIGGFCATNNGSATNCFFDKELAGTEDSAGSGSATGIVGLTTADMKKRASYTGWEISANGDWNIWENNTYPFWSKQVAPPVITVLNATSVQGICNTSNTPDSIVVYKNYERVGRCNPGLTTWQVALDGVPMQATDVLYAIAYLKGKEPSRPALVANIANDATLKSLAVNCGDLIPAFTPATLEYTIKPVGNNIAQATITAIVNSAKAVVIGAGNKMLNVGNNKLNIVVTSEDGSTTTTYSITIMRKSEDYTPSHDATLKVLEANTDAGSLITDFASDKVNYSVSVINSVETISLNALPKNIYATVTGVGDKNLNVGANTFVVSGIAEDGTTKRDYTVVVTRQAAGYTASNDASLKALVLNNGVVNIDFNANVYNYSTKVVGDISEINIAASPNQAGAQISGAGIKKLKVGTNEVTIVVTAEDGIVKKTYRILIERSAPTTAELLGITVSGTTINCSPGTSFSYVADCGVTVADIMVDANDGTTVVINGLRQSSYSAAIAETGASKISIALISADQLTTKQYELVLLRSLPATVVQLRWDNVLALTNNPQYNGGYYFTSFQWYKDGVTISGENQPYIHIDDSPSKYMVRVVTSDGYELQTCPLSNTMRNAPEQIIVYPNPVQSGGILNLELPDNGNPRSKLTVNIINTQGRVERSVTITDTKANITMPTQQGMYILQIIDGNKNIHASKVIVY